MTFEPRLHLSTTRLKVFDPSKVERQKVRGKPRGLWYACGDEWTRWLDSEPTKWKRATRHEYRYAYEIDVNPKAMLVIRTVKQIDAFNAKYGVVEKDEVEGYEPDDFTWIDWPRVTSEYAGIEICPHQDLRLSKWTWYSGWDVASGCIWSSEAIRGITEVDLP